MVTQSVSRRLAGITRDQGGACPCQFVSPFGASFFRSVRPRRLRWRWPFKSPSESAWIRPKTKATPRASPPLSRKMDAPGGLTRVAERGRSHRDHHMERSARRGSFARVGRFRRTSRLSSRRYGSVRSRGSMDVGLRRSAGIHGPIADLSILRTGAFGKGRSDGLGDGELRMMRPGFDDRPL